MDHRSPIRLILAIVLAGAIPGPAIAASPPGNGLAAAAPGYVDLVHEISAPDLGLAHPSALAFDSVQGVLVVGDGNAPSEVDASLLRLVSPAGHVLGAAHLPGTMADGVSLAFDRARNRLVGLAPGASALLEIPFSGGRTQGTSRRVDLTAAGIAHPAGIAVNGDLYVLDAAQRRIVRLAPDASGSFSATGARAGGRLRMIPLAGIGGSALRGLAVDPRSGHLLVLAPATRTLFEFDPTGRLVSTRDLAGIGLHDPQGMVMAPSADATDDPATVDLYVADAGTTVAGQPVGSGIVELSLSAPLLVTANTPQLSATLVQTIDTSRWSPASPDPSDLTYNPASGRLIMTDSEVEETTGAGWHHVNGWIFTLTGSVQSTFDTTTVGNKEPAGAAYNTDNGHLFVSNDSKQYVEEVTAGPDGLYYTSDDTRRQFSTVPAGYPLQAQDPEGVGYGGGKLFISDGIDKEIWIIDPGPNGIFDGQGDDVVTHFDVGALGQADPEDVEYDRRDGTLWVISHKTGSPILHVDQAGNAIAIVDTSAIPLIGPGGLTLAPGSVDQTQTDVYLADRGIDNGKDPTENDGKLFEVSVGSGPPPPPPGNLLLNPSFELDANGDGRPDAWTSNAAFTRPNPAPILPEAGSFVGRHSSTLDAGYNVYQPVSVTAGTTYAFSAWTNIPATSDAFAFKLKIQWRNSSGTISTQVVKTYTAATVAWSHATASLIAPAGATTARVIMVVSSLNATIYVDDFSFGAP